MSAEGDDPGNERGQRGKRCAVAVTALFSDLEIVCYGHFQIYTSRDQTS